jgi:hypothetical protein
VARAADVVPVFAVAGVGIAVVFVVMNVLVTWAPIAVATPSPSASAAPSFAPSPSLAEIVTASPSSTPAPTASLPASKPTLIRSAVSAKDPNGAWSVYLLYPTFQAGSTPWADEIDAQMTDEMQGRAVQWEQGPAANRKPSAKVNSLSGSFTTELLTPGIASFTLAWTDETANLTPGLGLETLTYDLGTGQRLAFSDVFPDATAALAVLSVTARTMLQDQLGAGYDPSVAVDGTSPSTANFSNWAVTPTGIRFTFAQYQVTTNSDAQPSIVMPWSILKPVMRQTGPLATLAGF